MSQILDPILGPLDPPGPQKGTPGRPENRFCAQNYVVFESGWSMEKHHERIARPQKGPILGVNHLQKCLEPLKSHTAL